jgi:hypothetical protein
MLFIDDLLLAPLHGLMWVFREIDDIAEKELAGEGTEVTRELSELYMRLDRGEITESEFTVEEARLLDRLDAIGARNDADEDAIEDELVDDEAINSESN